MKRSWLARTTRILLGSAALAALLLSVSVWEGPVVLAACHHFSVAASPNPVSEGAALTVTVSRDGAVASSSVQISTVDETAKANQDYMPLSRTVSFTNETQQTFMVSILDDNQSNEPTQTFRLHLSNPGGCAVNPNYVVDPDVRVTITEDGDQVTPAPPSATTPPRPSPTPTHSAPASTQPSEVALAPSPSPSPESTPSPSPSPSPSASPASSSNAGPTGGSLVPWMVGAIVVLVGAGTAYYFNRRRPAG